MKIEVSDKRNQHRLRPNGMSCSLGAIVDLSSDGMRLLSRRRLRGVHTVVLTGANQQDLNLTGRVVWHRRLSAGEHVYGLRFERLTYQQRDQLNELIGIASAGLPMPKPAGLTKYGMGGLMMVLVAFILTAGWYG